MTKIKLTDNLSLSQIIRGFWRLDTWKLSTDELIDNMKSSIDLGVTSFDTAEIYADTLCESQIGEAFAKDPALRGKVELISKTGIYKQEINGESFGYYNTTYDRIVRSCKESLQRLHTDYLDLYLIHREDPLLDPWEAGRAMLDLKKEGLIKEIGVSNFDPFKFDAMNKAVDGALVTNQIEWNPVCFEHFNSGMMDYLTVNKIHPMIWSPLAGGRLFQEDDLRCKKAMDKIKEIAERHNCEPDTIVYAWIMYHPVQAMPIVGSRKVERIESAVKAMDVKLEHYEWYEIYAASGQQQIR